MLFTLLAALLILFVFPLFGRHWIHLPRPVWVLFLVQPLAMASQSVVVFSGGLLGAQLAPEKALATLPIAALIVGVALATIPVALLLKKLNRKRGTLVGFGIAIIGALDAALAARVGNFWWFTFGCFMLGTSMAFVQQLRFAAMDSVSSIEDAPKAVSLLMLGGFFAAFIGPELAVYGRDLVPSVAGFSGSFFGLALMLLLAAAIFSQFEVPVPRLHEAQGVARPLGNLLRQPIFIIAVLAASIGYFVMSFIMTATPMAMNQLDGLSLNDTKWVLQSHIMAMYLPSFFSGYLIRRFGVGRILLSGVVIYLLMMAVALSGHHMRNYWWAMVLLGIGWNFLFLGGTVMLPKAYAAHERFKVQAVNDFIIFAVQASAALSAGWVLFSWNWRVLIYGVSPMLVLMLLVILWYRHQHHRRQALALHPGGTNRTDNPGV